MVGYNYGSKMAKIDFVVVKSSNNDRRRSRLSQRKSNGNDLLIDDFARQAGEYGVMWAFKFNGGGEFDKIFKLKWPSPKQILAGLEEFFEMQLRK